MKTDSTDMKQRHVSIGFMPKNDKEQYAILQEQ